MATYEYNCPQCDEPVEVFHSIHECDEVRYCPFHAAQVIERRVPSSVMFVLRGANHAEGWNGPTVRETQRAMEDTPEYKSGRFAPVGVRAVLR